jgi:hypothetical protein
VARAGITQLARGYQVVGAGNTLTGDYYASVLEGIRLSSASHGPPSVKKQNAPQPLRCSGTHA